VLAPDGTPRGRRRRLEATSTSTVGLPRESRISRDERERASAMGMRDPDAVLSIGDLVRGDVIFVASGVTSGPLLKGVRRIGDHLHIHTLALRSHTGTIRFIETQVDARRFPYQYVGK
jgi:fructose-1,6-bisphosphatase/sedoheptulose 1,7-bisphosphatase-like protein